MIVAVGHVASMATTNQNDTETKDRETPKDRWKDAKAEAFDEESQACGLHGLHRCVGVWLHELMDCRFCPAAGKHGKASVTCTHHG